MPGKKKPHAWAHERAEHIRKKNPDLPKGAEYGIAQLQEVAVGKEKDHGGKIKSSTRTKAKDKYKKPKSKYEQKAKGSGKKKSYIDQDKDLFVSALHKTVEYYNANGSVKVASIIDDIGRIVIGEGAEDNPEHNHAATKCLCDDGPEDANGNGSCDECGVFYRMGCRCGEVGMTLTCIGCGSKNPVQRVVVTEDGITKNGSLASSAIGMGVGALVGGGIPGAIVGGATSGVVDSMTSDANINNERNSIIKFADKLIEISDMCDQAGLVEHAKHAEQMLNALTLFAASKNYDIEGCCNNYIDRNGNGICDSCNCVHVRPCDCGQDTYAVNCNKCSAGTLVKKVEAKELLSKLPGKKDLQKSGSIMGAIGTGVLTGVAGSLAGAATDAVTGSDDE